jgi:hypothetical protein
VSHARLVLGLALLLLAPVGTHADPDDDEPQQKQQRNDKDDANAPLNLTGAQQTAVGIRVERPLLMRNAAPIEAFGTVLDPVTLVTDLGRVESTQAAAVAASADALRLERLYHDDAQASLKAWQSAQAQAAEAGAQARAAAMSFGLQWGPLAKWSEAQRRELLDALGKGEHLLLRADVAGLQMGSPLGGRALVQVDGVSIEARVLGPLPRTDATARSAGWLLQLQGALPGLGPGARALVRLQPSAATAGLLVPGTALVYAEQGAFVYRQVKGAAADSFRYESVPVKPLARTGSAWLVDGLHGTDQVVVQGAGVLWSLQGISSFSAAEEEHD